MTRDAPLSEDSGLDLELFGLELAHQVQTRITPQLKVALDRKEAEFIEALNEDPCEKLRQDRLAQEHADYQRRKERRQYVESGDAARATQPALAADLARQWKAPLIRRHRTSK